jgi:hypothetical protein
MMGTYEVYRIALMRFFKWLYSPDLPQRQRSRPAVIENIPKPKIHLNFQLHLAEPAWIL